MKAQDDYVAVLGHPKDKARQDILISIMAMEKVCEPFYEWYYEADPGTEHEAYLLERIKYMGDYLILCYEELQRRNDTEHDVIDLTTKLTERLDAKDHTRKSTQD